jgi:tyrosyl-tRNA synthetase
MRTAKPNLLLTAAGFSTKNSRIMASTDDEAEIDSPSIMPTSFEAPFLQTLLDRGFIHQCTDFKTLDDKMSSQIVPAYLGFDATASSLHVGSLLQIMILRTLQKNGHKPIILLGGGTTKVGDPTGKDESRKLLSEEIIASNAASIARVFEKFIVFGDGPTDAVMVNNADWLDEIKYLEFLRDYGRYFTINRMLSFESVKQRLGREQPFTFLEFNYMLLQSYDFLELYRRRGALLQMGGSDQWGNIIAGVELARKVDRAQVFGLTAPLITTSDGKKMGKSVSGAMWLDKELLSEFDYWQFWRNTADADVIRFLKLFTEVPLEEILKMESEWKGAALNDAKKILADEATRMLHGGECLAQIHATAASLFSAGHGGGGGADLESLPRFTLCVAESYSVVDLLVQSELAASKAEARRLIKGGGARINDSKVLDEKATVGAIDFDEHNRLKLSSGKKKHVLMVIS